MAEGLGFVCLKRANELFRDDIEELIRAGILTKYSTKPSDDYEGTLNCAFQTINGCPFADVLKAGKIAVQQTCFEDQVAADAYKAIQRPDF